MYINLGSNASPHHFLVYNTGGKNLKLYYSLEAKNRDFYVFFSPMLVPPKVNDSESPEWCCVYSNLPRGEADTVKVESLCLS